MTSSWFFLSTLSKENLPAVDINVSVDIHCGADININSGLSSIQTGAEQVHSASLNYTTTNPPNQLVDLILSRDISS